MLRGGRGRANQSTATTNAEYAENIALTTLKIRSGRSFVFPCVFSVARVCVLSDRGCVDHSRKESWVCSLVRRSASIR